MTRSQRLALRLGLHAHERTYVTTYVFGAIEASCWCGHEWPMEWRP